MNISDFAKLDIENDRLYIPCEDAISILEGELYDDISIIDSFRDDEEVDGSIYIHKIFFYKNSAWWLTGLYNFATKKFDLYSHDQQTLLESLNGHIGLPGVDPSETRILS